MQTRKLTESLVVSDETPAPTLDQIRQRARELFEARGRAPGHELNDWLQAEMELKSGRGPGGGKATEPANAMGHKPGIMVLCTAMVFLGGAVQTWSQTTPPATSSAEILAAPTADPNIWQAGIGEGFKPGTQSISFEVGAGPGVTIFGGRDCHDLALASISYGYMLGPVKGADHWYRGNWEVRGEVFGGGQFSPEPDWLVGLTPHLRYNFATGTRWVPFFDTGAGVSATSIGAPDLSRTFQFNLQAGTGVRWFLRNNVALSLEVRYLHVSCAGMNTPNQGLNNVNGMVGVTWFF